MVKQINDGFKTAIEGSRDLGLDPEARENNTSFLKRDDLASICQAIDSKTSIFSGVLTEIFIPVVALSSSGKATQTRVQNNILC